ncbi:WYL domain-containing protein [Azonexus sp.]|uniref:WYL domain-containing protein n=1 Tax=Azonexus sp. TaxID=1872668 RepID=UPI0039E569B4
MAYLIFLSGAMVMAVAIFARSFDRWPIGTSITAAAMVFAVLAVILFAKRQIDTKKSNQRILQAPTTKRPLPLSQEDRAKISALIDAGDYEENDAENDGWIDDWSNSFISGVPNNAPSKFSPKPIRAVLNIQYVDVNGKKTRRTVHVSECDTRESNGYLKGFCQLRRAPRTFRLDRVIVAIDVETGERIQSLHAWARNRHVASNDFAVETSLRESADALRAIFYLCKLDGRFTRKEKEIFLKHCQSMVPDRLLKIEDIENACQHLVLPSQTAFYMICQRLAELPLRERESIIVVANQIVDSDKTVKPEESEALDYLTAQLAGR